MRWLRHLLARRRRMTAASHDMTRLERRMHAEFASPDFLERLVAFYGLGPDDSLTREHFAAFDAHRRAEHRRALETEHEPGPGDAAG